MHAEHTFGPMLAEVENILGYRMKWRYSVCSGCDCILLYNNKKEVI